MKTTTIALITAAGLSLFTNVAQAEVVAAKTKTSFTQAGQSKVIASCVDAIERHHRKEARLFLNKSGQFKSGADRAFSIQGWVWKNGERVKADHDCIVNDSGKGLLLSINYADERKVATGNDNQFSPKS